MMFKFGLPAFNFKLDLRRRDTTESAAIPGARVLPSRPLSIRVTAQGRPSHRDRHGGPEAAAQAARAIGTVRNHVIRPSR